MLSNSTGRFPGSARFLGARLKCAIGAQGKARAWRGINFMDDGGKDGHSDEHGKSDNLCRRRRRRKVSRVEFSFRSVALFSIHILLRGFRLAVLFLSAEL